MGDDDRLNYFAEELRQAVLGKAAVEELMISDAFTATLMEYLSDAGEIEDGEPCFHKARGIEVHGYNISEDESTLDVFACIQASEAVPPCTIAKSEFEAVLNRLLGYVSKAFDSYHGQLEPASPVYDMTLRIWEVRERLSQIRCYVVTDGLTTVKAKHSDQWRKLKRTFHIWDIQRIYRCVSSGQQRESIEVDFVRDFGGPVPCLSVPVNGREYGSFLAIIPGNVLSKIYEEYGPRLLELNVRSFLQARGGVNKGIRETILKQPERFLAYNNGISITATEIKLVKLPDGGKGIAWAKDLQIVNGGQTTASIYQAAKKDKADTALVHVQAKLSVVDAIKVSELVPLISRYSNSQNKVNEADFSANAPFHVETEALSRTVWAPASDGTQHQTKWFYERARGQYIDAKARQPTPAKKRDFTAIYPSSQKFTKTDLAKFENTWHELPYKVSFGAEKNFREFTLRLQEEKPIAVDQSYYQQLIAKAILFRSAEKIVQEQKFGGYRAQIVTYTLAYLIHITGRRLDLNRVWREQGLAIGLEDAVRKTSHAVHKVITTEAGGRNVTEWCKKEDCWTAVKQLRVALPAEFTAQAISRKRF
jgi:hypothetical protein